MHRLIKIFLKHTLIAFYKEKDTFLVQKIIIKNKNIISEEEFQFNEEEFLNFIQSCFIENTQTYISTIIDTFNQGCVDSCSHSRYKEIGINIENIKILCLKDYSIFIGLYELNEFKKEIKKYQVDFVFSPYLIIDMNNKNTANTLYLLITKTFIAVVIYQKPNIPLYSNIFQLKIETNNDSSLDEDTINDDIDDNIDDDIELIEDIEDLDDLDDLNENIDEDIDDFNDIDNINDSSNNMQEDMSEIKNELETLEFLKNSIKDYYESYSDEFLSDIHILYNEDISDKFIKNIKEETLLEVDTKKINILSYINELAKKETDV